MPASPECLLVLASASPRRRRLVSWLGLPVEYLAVDTPEELDTPLASEPRRLAVHLAAEKAREATRLWSASSNQHGATVIAAFDTIVVLDGRVLGKPESIDDAWRMLRALSGRTHDVVTGVAIVPSAHAAAADVPGAPDVPGTFEPLEFAVTTPVRMKTLTDADIEEWMARGEFMGCAGAYNIEGQVAEVDIDECFQNVAGLPLCHVRAALASIGLPAHCAPRSPVEPCDRSLSRTCELGPLLAEPPCSAEES